MAALPDEIWREILNLGIKKSKFTCKDLCCISISSKRLNKLSNEDIIWSSLLTLDFPQSKSPLQSPLKNLYKFKFEKDKERKLATHRRAVLRIESQVAVRITKLKESRHQLVKENEKLKVAVEELKNLERVRSASVALNVWQPEIVRGKQKRFVEQCVVPAESRVSGLEMEIRVCKHQIKVLEKGYNDEKQRLNVAKKELGLMKYHPVRDHHPLAETSSLVNESKTEQKRKKVKQCSETSHSEHSQTLEKNKNIGELSSVATRFNDANYNSVMP